jgi:hypothetical protein
MKTKPIKIDWEGLEDAFNDQREELIHYLDLVTGHVVLEGEGEVDEREHDEEDYDGRVPAPVAPPPLRDDSTRIYVHPPDTDQKIEWLLAFLDGSSEVGADESAELREAMDSDDPAEEVASVLKRYPKARDAWFRFRAERIRTLIDEWLAARGVVAVEPPPWKR